MSQDDRDGEGRHTFQVTAAVQVPDSLIRRREHAEEGQPSQRDRWHVTRITQALGAGAAIVAVVVSTCALKSAERAFKLSERPWVYLDVGLIKNADMNVAQNGTVAAGVTIKLRNVGKSVAVDVRTYAELALLPKHDNRLGAIDYSPLAGIQDAACARAAKEEDSTVVFPGQLDVEYDTTVWGTPAIGDVGALHVVGCVDYISAIDPERAHHQTTFFKRLRDHPDNWFGVEEGTIPAADLMLTPSGGYQRAN